MRISGELALHEAQDALEAALAANSDADAMRVGEDFFGLSDIVRADSRLRRALTDPARPAQDKRKLVDGMAASHVQPITTTVLHRLVASHWSDPMDLHDACEVLGIICVMEDARRTGSLEQLSTELFEVTDFLAGQRDLRLQLSDMGPGTGHDRADIAEKLFGPHLSRWTMRLVRRAVARTSHGRLLSTLRRFSERAAEVQGRQLVTVESGSPMTAAQLERLREILRRRFGRDVTVTVSLTPDLIGGFRLRMGTTALDSSIRTQVSNLRRAVVA